MEKIYKLLWNGLEQKQEFKSKDAVQKYADGLILDKRDTIGYRVRLQ